jgi:hypothetical protein
MSATASAIFGSSLSSLAYYLLPLASRRLSPLLDLEVHRETYMPRAVSLM